MWKNDGCGRLFILKAKFLGLYIRPPQGHVHLGCNVNKEIQLRMCMMQIKNGMGFIATSRNALIFGKMGVYSTKPTIKKCMIISHTRKMLPKNQILSQFQTPCNLGFGHQYHILHQMERILDFIQNDIILDDDSMVHFCRVILKESYNPYTNALLCDFVFFVQTQMSTYCG